MFYIFRMQYSGSHVTSFASPLHRTRGNPSNARPSAREARLASLREAIARIERKQSDRPGDLLSISVPEIHAHLPRDGLAAGVLHEVMAAAYSDRPSAFGFACALMVRALRDRPGPAMLVMSAPALSDHGRPHAHGLRQLGIDLQRLVLIETRNDKDAHWALEETLRSQARPAIVVAAVGGALDLTVSRRLNLAAAAHGTAMVVVRASNASGTTAAATRWRISSMAASADRFGVPGKNTWHARLERCRNGRPGEWLIEWTDVPHCFRLAQSLADRTPASCAAIRLAG
jgi:protein ImuA